MLGAIEICEAIAQKSDPAKNSDNASRTSNAAKAAPQPVVSIENFRSWVESQGETRIIWTAWEVVTRHPVGSNKSQALTGMQRQAYQQRRSDWDKGLRAAFWQAWASQVLNERQAGIPEIARNFDVFQRYLDANSGLIVNSKDHNLNLMLAGKAPIGTDGKRVNVHHVQPLRAMGSNSFANLKTMNATEHQRNSSALHGTAVTRELVVMAQHFKL